MQIFPERPRGQGSPCCPQGVRGSDSYGPWSGNLRHHMLFSSISSGRVPQKSVQQPFLLMLGFLANWLHGPSRYHCDFSRVPSECLASRPKRNPKLPKWTLTNCTVMASPRHLARQKSARPSKMDRFLLANPRQLATQKGFQSHPRGLVPNA